MDHITVINQSIDWHRPRPQNPENPMNPATIMCRCSDLKEYDSFGYVAHLKVEIRLDLERYGRVG